MVSENRLKLLRERHKARWLLTSLPSSSSSGIQHTDVSDRFQSATQKLHQELIDAEATAFIGAAPFERSLEPVTQRNGTRPRRLTTTAGRWICGSRSCGRGRSSRRCWSGAAVSTKLCSRW